MARLSTLLALSPVLLYLASAECNRTELLAFVDGYVAAQNMGFLGYLEGADPYNFSYLENNKSREITTGVLGKILHVDRQYTAIDLVNCATFTELIITDPAHPYVIGTQIRHQTDGRGVYLIDSIVSTTGSWLFNASQTLSYATKENWDPVIPPEQRSSRDDLMHAADTYLDMWQNGSAIAAVPWGTPCDRLEGSVYTGNGSPTDSCMVGIPTNNTQPPNSGRRYVVDEEGGTISVLCVFEHLNMAPDSHLFRLLNGKLRYIHTITVTSSS
ncbi:uncharacterized protein BCR38DRAFT_460767 [Pseudomassariella vexata]|uniref:DUF8021 domain-containing protein n=1 Tax=Pseudomassariella vexata TaxID=1141098 RepID=A0A1Y2DGJ4_9PEZI|nr:uncharacterized protein BCR38DRAFT_460767 [Pseudomassariella vexata]ORY58392.1 hypothetical protein BCR38DRAFT_460767 [Pseudomassariella vexata]